MTEAPVADLIFATATEIPEMIFGAALWGVHIGFSQGLLAALVAETAPSDGRGTAFDLFNLFSSITLLLSSVVAGDLWDRAAPKE
jgi:MFS family permease